MKLIFHFFLWHSLNEFMEVGFFSIYFERTVPWYAFESSSYLHKRPESAYFNWAKVQFLLFNSKAKFPCNNRKKIWIESNLQVIELRKKHDFPSFAILTNTIQQHCEHCIIIFQFVVSKKTTCCTTVWVCVLFSKMNRAYYAHLLLNT